MHFYTIKINESTTVTILETKGYHCIYNEWKIYQNYYNFYQRKSFYLDIECAIYQLDTKYVSD